MMFVCGDSHTLVASQGIKAGFIKVRRDKFLVRQRNGDSVKRESHSIVTE